MKRTRFFIKLVISYQIINKAELRRLAQAPLQRPRKFHRTVTVNSLQTRSMFTEVKARRCSLVMTETFAPARFNFALPPTSTRVRTAWISDVHLGTRASGAVRL